MGELMSRTGDGLAGMHSALPPVVIVVALVVDHPIVDT